MPKSNLYETGTGVTGVDVKVGVGVGDRVGVGDAEPVGVGVKVAVGVNVGPVDVPLYRIGPTQRARSPTGEPVEATLRMNLMS